MIHCWTSELARVTTLALTSFEDMTLLVKMERINYCQYSLPVVTVIKSGVCVVLYSPCSRCHSASCRRCGLKRAIERQRLRHGWDDRSVQSTKTAFANVIRHRRHSGATASTVFRHPRRPLWRRPPDRLHHTASRSAHATCCVSLTCTIRTRAQLESGNWPTAPVCPRRRSETGLRIVDRGIVRRPLRTGARINQQLCQC